MNKKTHDVKCVVWDLDNTIWNGILLEDHDIAIKPDVVKAIRDLDSLGILNSIASKNDYITVLKKLESYELTDYFLYPQIGWQPKSESVVAIKEKLNIGYESILFVDDDPYEREEVSTFQPSVRCIDANRFADIFELYVDRNALPTKISKQRRKLYQNEIKREELEKSLQLPKSEFLKSLNMQLVIQEAREEHLQRCEELTLRTHQLNSTGIIYTKKELEEFSKQHDKQVLVCELVDRIGSYGLIALAYIEKSKKAYRIKLLITSCRVMSRGIGSILLSYIMQCAKNENKVVEAEFVGTGKNKNMYITYKFSGFTEVVSKENENVLFIHDCVKIPSIPDYIKLTIL